MNDATNLTTAERLSILTAYTGNVSLNLFADFIDAGDDGDALGEHIMDIFKFLQENFKLITREEYRNCDLSNTTKKILCDIGLPKKPLNFLQFNIEEIENIKLEEKYIIIGHDFGTNICINHKDEIVSIDLENEYPIRFINKSLEAFLKFIIFLSYREKIDDEDDEISRVIQEIRNEFDMIDIQALSNEENWWPIILEQIELGLM